MNTENVSLFDLTQMSHVENKSAFFKKPIPSFDKVTRCPLVDNIMDVLNIIVFFFLHEIFLIIIET